jgi:hypothetical protein
MSTVGAISTARSTILVVISSNLPIPGRFAVALRDRVSYHLDLAELIETAKDLVSTIEQPNTSGHLVEVDDEKLFLPGVYPSQTATE